MPLEMLTTKKNKKLKFKVFNNLKLNSKKTLPGLSTNSTKLGNSSCKFLKSNISRNLKILKLKMCRKYT
jgi:hypothetical protein